MTFDELSLMAFRNDPLPRFVKLHEMTAYFGLQNIYWSYEHRFISKDQAAKRKNELQYRFEDEAKKYEDSLKDHQYIDQIRVALGGQFKAVKESGCPVCRRLIEILDGRNLSEGQDT